MTEVYKTMHDMEKVSQEKLCFLSHNTIAHAQPVKLNVERFRADKRKKFCMQHMIKLWNSFPQEEETATNLDGFAQIHGG